MTLLLTYYFLSYLSEHRVLPPDLRKDIEQFAFEGYALRHFSTHKIGIFRRKVSMQKMMHWQKVREGFPISTVAFVC